MTWIVLCFQFHAHIPSTFQGQPLLSNSCWTASFCWRFMPSKPRPFAQIKIDTNVRMPGFKRKNKPIKTFSNNQVSVFTLNISTNVESILKHACSSRGITSTINLKHIYQITSTCTIRCPDSLLLYTITHFGAFLCSARVQHGNLH